VDTIALLEEKNRIRRNLEGFTPLTVSKLKEDQLFLQANYELPQSEAAQLRTGHQGVPVVDA